MSTGLMATPGQKLGARQQDDPARCRQVRLCPGSVSSNEDNAVHRKPKPRRAHCWPSCPTVKSCLGGRVTPQARGSEGKEAGADARGAGLTPPASKTVSVSKGGTRAGLWALVTCGSRSSEPLGLGGNYLIRTRSGGKRGYGSPGTRTTGRCLPVGLAPCRLGFSQDHLCFLVPRRASQAGHRQVWVLEIRRIPVTACRRAFGLCPHVTSSRVCISQGGHGSNRIRSHPQGGADLQKTPAPNTASRDTVHSKWRAERGESQWRQLRGFGHTRSPTRQREHSTDASPGPLTAVLAQRPNARRRGADHEYDPTTRVHGTHSLGPETQMGESKGQKDASCTPHPIRNSTRKIPLSDNSFLRLQFMKQARGSYAENGSSSGHLGTSK